MKRFLRILLFLCLIQIGQFSVVSIREGICENTVAESVLETDGYSSDRYSDYDSPCGSGSVSVPAPSLSPSENGGSHYFGNSRRVKTSASTHYFLFRSARLQNRHGIEDFGRLLSCHLYGASESASRLSFLCSLKN